MYIQVTCGVSFALEEMIQGLSLGEPKKINGVGGKPTALAPSNINVISSVISIVISISINLSDKCKSAAALA